MKYSFLVSDSNLGYIISVTDNTSGKVKEFFTKHSCKSNLEKYMQSLTEQQFKDIMKG